MKVWGPKFVAVMRDLFELAFMIDHDTLGRLVGHLEQIVADFKPTEGSEQK